MGDALFRTPLFPLFKKIFPNAAIDVITVTKLAEEILQNSQYIRKVFSSPDVYTIKKIANNYDLFINSDDMGESDQFLPFFKADKIEWTSDDRNNIPHAEQLVGYFANAFDYNYDDFNIHYDLFPQKVNFANVEKLLKNTGSKILIGMHLGCHGLAKKRSRIFKRSHHPKAWPLEKFIKLAKKLQKINPNVTIVLTGSKAEEKLGEKFCKKIYNVINLINKTSVLDMAALMRYLKLFIVNDTGALHVACTTNVNLIVLFGDQSNPAITGPYPKRGNQIEIYKANINKISVNEVFQRMCETFKDD